MGKFFWENVNYLFTPMNNIQARFFDPYFRQLNAKRKDTSDQEESLNNFSQKILDSIIDDNADEFIELISQTLSADPNQTFSLTNYKLPMILQKNPTYASLCSFFGSENCFESLCTLLPDGCSSSQMKKLDDYNCSPVHFACAGGSLSILRELERANHDLNAPDINNYTPSCYAAMSGQIEVLKYLWTKGAEIVRCRQFVYSPITFEMACLYGHTNIVKFMYEQVFPILNESDKEMILNGSKWFNLFPFHLACFNGNLEIVKYLFTIEEIVNNQLNAVDDKGMTPLCYACLNGSLNVVKFLVNSQKLQLVNAKRKKMLPLVEAASCGHDDIVSFLIKQEFISIQEENSNKVCALQAAIKNGHVYTTKLLIINGAASNYKENEINELFLLALQTCSMEIVKLLDQYLSIPYDKNYDLLYTHGDRYMQQACLLENIEIVSFLLSKNCTLDKIDLTENVCKDWTEFMDLLNEKINILNMKSRVSSPLIVETIKGGNLSRLKTMISKGFVLDSEIISKYNCILIVCGRGKIDMFRFLMKYNPKIENIPVVIEKCVERFSVTKKLKHCGKKFITMIDKILATEQYDLKDNLNDPYIESSISITASSGSVELLQIFAKYGYDFTHCKLNYSRMRSKIHMPIYKFLEENGCKFDVPVRGFCGKTCSSALSSLFDDSFLVSFEPEVLIFLLKYASSDDIKGVKNRYGNIIDNLLVRKYYHLIAKVYNKCKSMIFPLNLQKNDFLKLLNAKTNIKINTNTHPNL